MIGPGQIKALAASAVIAGAALAGWTIRDWQAQAEAGARATAELAAQQRIDRLAEAVSTRTEAAIQNIRIENKSIYNEVQREIRTNTVYRECVVPIDGLRLVNQARAGQPADAVPAARPAAADGGHGAAAGR